MVKKERVIGKVEEKKKQKQHLQEQLGVQENQCKLMKQQIEELDLEISLLEDHVKKMDG